MNAFYEGMAEILEIDISVVCATLELSSEDTAWDSLAVVSTIALVDDCFNVMLNGTALGECATIGDIEKLISKLQKV